MKRDEIDHIGTRIKERRKKMAMTISELALYTDLSTGYLSNIERNQTSPTLNNLKRICEALGASMTEMIRTEAGEQILVRRKEMGIREYPERNHVVRTIKFGVTDDIYEYVTVLPGEPKVIDENMHAFAEIGTVLKGSLSVTIEGEEYKLNKGDSIYIKPRSMHSIKNLSDSVCESFWHYKRENGS